MKNKLYTIMGVLITVFCVSCFGSGMSDSLDTGTGLDDEGSTTSITVIGNPSLKVNNTGTVYLIDNLDSDNFKFFSDTSIESVLSLTVANTDLAEDAILDTPVPAIDGFVLSPNNETEMVFVLEASFVVNDQNCFVVFVDSAEEKCIHEAKIQDKPQFDANGNVYFYDNNLELGTEGLVKWAKATGEKIYITNPNFELAQQMVHADGTVYLTDTAGSLRTVSPDNILSNRLSGDRVDSFNIVDANILLLQGEITFEEEQSYGYYFYDHTEKEIIAVLDYNGNADLSSSMYVDGENRILVQDGDSIIKIYPGVSEIIELGLTQINFSIVHDNTLFASGRVEGTQKFVKLDLSDEEAAPVTVLSGHEVYNAELGSNSNLYYDAQNFNTNQYYLGILDVTTNDVIFTEEVLDGSVVNIDSVYSINNNSFSEITFETNTPYALVRAATAQRGEFVKGRLLEDVDLTIDFDAEIYRKRFQNGKLRFTVDSAASIRVIKPRLNWVYEVESDATDTQDLSHLNIDKITLLSASENLVGILATRKIYGDQVFKIYSYEVNESERSVSFTFEKSIMLDDRVYNVKASETADRIHLVSRRGDITMYNFDLELLAESRVFFGRGNVSIVSDTNGFLLLRSSFMTSANILRSKLLILDVSAGDYNHIQTIRVKANRHLLNASLYDSETMAIKTYSRTTDMIEYYILEENE